MDHHSLEPNILRERIRTGQIRLAGNKNLKIYGLLNCTSGKRMKIEHRIFFRDEKEAELLGFRPCGKCLPAQYRKWKAKRYSKQESG